MSQCPFNINAANFDKSAYFRIHYRNYDADAESPATTTPEESDNNAWSYSLAPRILTLGPFTLSVGVIHLKVRLYSFLARMINTPSGRSEPSGPTNGGGGSFQTSQTASIVPEIQQHNYAVPRKEEGTMSNRTNFDYLTEKDQPVAFEDGSSKTTLGHYAESEFESEDMDDESNLQRTNDCDVLSTLSDEHRTNNGLVGRIGESWEQVDGKEEQL